MKILSFLSKFLFIFLATLIFSVNLVHAGAKEDLQKKIDELQSKITDLQGQERTLSSQIGVMNSQISLTELQISSTKQQINDLTLDIDTTTKKITNIEKSLDNLTKVLINRVVATYEIGSAPSFQILATSNNVTDFVKRANYLRLAQAHDKRLIYDTVQAKNDYQNQKDIFENKKEKVQALNAQLEAYSAQLDQEKANKQSLLNQTKGSEATYQALLAETKAEYEAIQGIVSGNGTEGEFGAVSQGDVIATVKQGASCNSSGTHLHFTVSRNGNTENPFNFLKPIDHVDYSGGDPWNPAGSWEWPISAPIQFNQGYGNTSFSSSGASFYSFHNGLDISSSSVVRAVKSGSLFQGSYTGNAGCRLQYVRVHHSDDGLDSFYLHVNYVH